MLNMVKFINVYSGTPMWVSEDRQEEYIAEGHKLFVEETAGAEIPKKKAGKKKEG